MNDSTKPIEVRRFPRSGDEEIALWIEIKRPDYSTFRLARGSTLHEVLRRLEPTEDFLLITSFRGDRSMRDNERSFTHIPRDARGLLKTEGILGYWLVGHWTDCPLDMDGKPFEHTEGWGGNYAIASSFHGFC